VRVEQESLQLRYILSFFEPNVRSACQAARPTKIAKIGPATARWEADLTNLAAAAELALVRLRQGDYPGAGRLTGTMKQPLARLAPPLTPPQKWGGG